MRASDIIKRNGKTYTLYWQTALDGKTWCRVKVKDERGSEYQISALFQNEKGRKDSHSGL